MTRAALGNISALGVALLLWSAQPASAAPPTKSDPNPSVANTSQAARQNAIRGIPFDKLDANARAKVNYVLADIAVFRRLPTQVIECDPDLYLFLIQHPDVVVNIWEVLKLSSLKLKQTGANTYCVTEAVGARADVEFLYRSHDTHVVYADGLYDGPFFARPVHGRGLIVLKSAYVQETNGRYYITVRLDGFVRVEQAGAEVLAKLLHPLVGKTADDNFMQTAAFLGSLSRTAEVNSQGVQRLATRLNNVQPEYRQQLAVLAAAIAEKYAATPATKTTEGPRVASHAEPVAAQR